MLLCHLESCFVTTPMHLLHSVVKTLNWLEASCFLLVYFYWFAFTKTDRFCYDLHYLWMSIRSDLQMDKSKHCRKLCLVCKTALREDLDDTKTYWLAVTELIVTQTFINNSML